MDQTRTPVNELRIAFTEDAFQCLPPAEAQKVQTKLRRLLRVVQRADDARKSMEEYDHTVHELVVGRFIQEQGYTPCFEPDLDGQTPDWLFTGTQGRASFFGEVANARPAERIGRKMQEAVKKHNSWCGFLPDNVKRLLDSMDTKACTYKALAEGRDLPYAVFLYTYFDAFVEPAVLRRCLFDEEYGLFRSHRHLSAVCQIEAGVDCWHGAFFHNPDAVRPLEGVTAGSLLCPLSPGGASAVRKADAADGG